MTEPGAIAATMSSVSSTGALRPGISAVQMTMSMLFSASAILSRWRRWKSSPISLA